VDAPTVTGQTSAKATVTTTLHLATGDEKVSTQSLTFTTISDHGWWVCDISTSAK